MDKLNYNKYLKLRNDYNKKVNIISSIRLIVFILMILSFFISSSNNIYVYIGFVFLIFFLLLIFIHDKYYKLLDYYNKYIIILDEYKDRKSGKWREFSDKGNEYNNYLFSDLNIVGDNSLFQYLSICNTIGGRDKLINKLSDNKCDNKELIKRQDVIKDLTKMIDFDISFQVSMFDFRNKKINLEEGINVLNKKVGNKKVDLFIGLLFSLLSLILLFFGYLKIISLNYFYGMFIFNFFVNYMYSYIYNKEFNDISIVSLLYGKLSNTFDLIINNNYNSLELNKIYKDVKDSYGMVKKIQFIDNLNNLKNNILASFIFNGLFCVNIIVMYLYSYYQTSNIYSLKKGICDIEELEAYISLAGVGIVNNNVCMPVMNDDVSISFNNMKHPLIDNNRCVGNDFKGTNGVNIITGSNMGGKTTFIRTIGINLILMYAGTFVCADSFSSSYFKIYTSISVGDDISKGISTFYNELLRIKEAIDNDKDNRIILVDEIFKGTNYNDRIYGAKEVIKKFNDNRTILFVTTHDFELCDIKGKNINNYYVKEFYEDDNIKFDYKIREGKCTSTNAMYLMKKLKIID